MHKNNPARFGVAITLLLAGFFFGGCASIVHSGNRAITINSDPSGAKATLISSEGIIVAIKYTPCTVSLDPKRDYFKGQRYVVKLELPGYQTAEVQLTPSLSGWYWGNLVFGGLIGMVVVDPITGSMWNLEPAKVQEKLHPSQVEIMRGHKGFAVVLLSELTPAERAGMQRIN